MIAYRSLWSLDPAIAYLNHGSYGACPIAVLEKQAALRARMEREPVDFLLRDLPGLLDAAREETARFVGSRPEDLVFVPNATTGVNAVLKSLPFEAGDEVLTTSHVYGACRKTLEHVAARTGIHVVVARVPFPVTGEDDVVDAVLEGVSPRTRLALVDHVPSASALVFPLARLVGELASRGVETLVDGAHALGAVPIDLEALGAAYYAANAHKWLCAPKGAALLHVRRDRQRGLHPMVTSHAYSGDAPGRLRAEFDWTGTFDPSAWLCIPESIRFLETRMPGGWTAVAARNHALALEARRIVGDALGVGPACPDEMVGSMASIPVPDRHPKSPAATMDPDTLSGWCRERGVEPWFSRFPWPDGLVTRVSAQLYNETEDYRRLVGVLLEAIREP